MLRCRIGHYGPKIQAKNNKVAMGDFFTELRRRNVFKVATVYVIVGWVLVQIADVAAENFGAPEWVMKMFIVFMVLGFPVAMIFAWAFEMTADGLKLEKNIERSDSISICGNGVSEETEVCDGVDLGGQTCLTLGFDGGPLACAVDCNSFDISGCSGIDPIPLPTLNTPRLLLLTLLLGAAGYVRRCRIAAMRL